MKSIQNRVYVVTGGGGYVGATLVRHLLASGALVRVVDVQDDHGVLSPAVKYVQGSILDARLLGEVFAGAHGVFHLAAMVSVPYSIEHPRETALTNVVGTVQVLESALAAGVPRVVFASSSAVYGDQDSTPIAETAPCRPGSPYGFQKREGEEYCKLMTNLKGLETVSLRCFNIFGNQEPSFAPHASVISRFLAMKQSGTPLTITGTGAQVRDFVHVEDVVRAYVAAMVGAEVGAGEAINIGSGQGVSIAELARISGLPTITIPERLEIRNSIADVRLAKQLLDWQPEVDVRSAIAELFL